MQQFEYRVLPAPGRGERVKGARTTADRYAHALMAIMNDLGRDGWEYLRTDTLPCEERVGLMRRATTTVTMLVFRRATEQVARPDGMVAAPMPAPAPGLLRAAFPFGSRPPKAPETPVAAAPPRIALVTTTPPGGGPSLGPATGNGVTKP